MVNINLVKHIKDNLNKGKSIDFIRRDLISQHWSSQEVDEAINFVQSNKKISDLEPEPEEKKNFPRGAKIFIGVVFILILVGLLMFYLMNYSKPPISYITISEFNILEGVSIDVSPESQVNFTLNNKDYNFKLESVGENHVSFSGDFSGEIFLGEKKSFDLDSDSLGDIEVRLDLVNSDIATLYLKKYGNFVCPENWNCTDWGPCLEGFQKRICVDLNSCETELNKPELEMTCNG